MKHLLRSFAVLGTGDTQMSKTRSLHGEALSLLMDGELVGEMQEAVILPQQYFSFF